jgi:hypothetical protein
MYDKIMEASLSPYSVRVIKVLPDNTEFLIKVESFETEERANTFMCSINGQVSLSSSGVFEMRLRE